MIVFQSPSGEPLHRAKKIRGLNVLGHAQLDDFFLGSECGGHGVCGKDRVRISKEDREHFSPPTEKENKHLSSDQLADGVRLACQAYLQSEEVAGEIKIECLGIKV